MKAATLDPQLQPAIDRAEFARRFKELRACCVNPELQDVWPRYQALAADFERLADEGRARLLGTSLTWTEEEEALARWLHRACDGFASLGFRLSGFFEKSDGIAEARTIEAMASSLYFMGETLKWEVTVTTSWVNDLRKTHALMRLAMGGGQHRKPIRMRVDGREADCTLESLYFRVLLLWRFASGTLNVKQIEILDAWMWMWMPVLQGVPQPGPGAMLRVDLDSCEGLKRGPRADHGPSLYLMQEPIERVYEALLAEFHAGRICPSTGRTAAFRIEEHVAVLGLIRQGLQRSKAVPARAERHTCEREVEVLVGLAEILSRGFAAMAPQAPLGLATMDGGGATQRAGAGREDALGDVYNAQRRMARLVNESDTGLGLEGPEQSCGAIAAGDLVAVRVAPGQPLVLGKVVRSVPSKSADRVVLGVQRLATSAQVVSVRRDGETERAPATPLVFLPGSDPSGCHDACLVSERAYAERGTLLAPLDGNLFTVRINRARQAGRGWVLAGFEVISSRPEDEFQIA